MAVLPLIFARLIHSIAQIVRCDVCGACNLPEGTDMIYKLAKTRNRRTKDISDNIYISDADGNILTDHEKIKDRWQ